MQYNLMKIFYDRNANNRNSGSNPTSLKTNYFTYLCPICPEIWRDGVRG